MIGGGAALSALAGMALSPGSGPMPLLLIMLTVSVLGVISILYVIDREKKVRIV